MRSSWMSVLSLGVVCMGLLGATLAADAQSKPDTAEEIDEATGRTIRFEKKSELDFTDPLLIDGQLIGPDGKLVMTPPVQRFNPLIQLRQNWNAEMERSIDEIK